MKPRRILRPDVLVIAVVVAMVAAWLPAGRVQRTASPVQLAQEVYGSPVGEYDGAIGGPMVYGEAVGSPALDSPTLYGEPVGSASIGGPMLYGGPVGSAPIGGPTMYGAPVGMGGDDAPIGGAPLY